jgi:hypothetical protein
MGDVQMIGHKDQLDLWLKDGSLEDGDIIYTVTKSQKVVEKTYHELEVSQ